MTSVVMKQNLVWFNQKEHMAGLIKAVKLPMLQQWTAQVLREVKELHDEDVPEAAGWSICHPKGVGKLNCTQVRDLFLLVMPHIFFLFLVTYPISFCWLAVLSTYSCWLYIYICLLIFVTHPPVLLGKMLLVVKLQPIQTCGLDRWLLCGRWDLWTYHRYITRKWMICP